MSVVQPEGVIVEDIPRGLSDEVVQQYFFSRGGEMRVFRFHEEARKAEIMFEDPEVVTKILSSSHKIGRHVIRVVVMEQSHTPTDHPDIGEQEEGERNQSFSRAESKFMQENEVTGSAETCNVVFESGEWRVLSLDMASMRQEIESRADVIGVNISYFNTETSTTVSASGTMPHAQEICEAFLDLRKHVFTASKTFDYKPYLWGVLKSIKDSISLLEHDYNVAITIAPKSSNDTDSVVTHTVMTGTVDQCNIEICCGDITQHPTATTMICLLVQSIHENQLLPLIEAGGRKVFNDIICRVKELSTCALPQVFESKVYNLKIKKLINCIVLKLNPNDKTTSDVLQEGLKRAMKCLAPPCVVIHQVPSVQIPPVQLLELIMDEIKNDPQIPPGLTFALYVFNQQEVKDTEQFFRDRNIELKFNDSYYEFPELFKTDECSKMINICEIRSDFPSFVSVISGSILDQEVQVYVNSTNSDLDLSRGALSKQFLKIVGQKLQDQCKEYAPLPIGEVAITSAEHLPCDVIMHVCLPSYTAKGSQRMLRETFKHILKVCQQKSLTSIAVPPIGTGKLDYPPNVVANLIFSEVFEFNERYPNFFKKVILVHSAKDVYENFMKVFVEKQLQYSTRYKINGDEKKNTIDRKSAVLFVKHCAMEDEIVDVIVNPITVGRNITDSPLLQSLSKNAGETIQAQLDERSVIIDDDHKCYFFTKATGKLRCKKILHIYNPKKIDDANDILSPVVLNILSQVEEEEYSSVCIPLVGVGYELKEKAMTIIQACITFSQNDQLHLEKITLITNTAEEYESVCSCLSIFKGKRPVLSNPTFEESIDSMHLQQWSRLPSKRRSIQPWDAMDIRKLECKDAVVNVYSSTAEHGSIVLGEIESKITKEIVTHVIEDSHIEHLIKSEINDVNCFVSSKGVAVTFVNQESRIYLSGERGLVEVAKTHIEKVLDTLKSARSMLSQFVWHKETSEGRDMISDEISARLEIALMRDVKWLEVQCGDGIAVVDLRNMIEIDMNSGKISSICRVEKPKFGVPRCWESMPVENGKEKSCHLFNIPGGTEEYECGIKEFKETMYGKRFMIVKLERVQNVNEYSKHCAFLDVLKRKYNGDVLLKRLFHGTSSESIEAIAHQGFNRIFAADANAAVFGKGVYFASRANYSAQPKYCVPDQLGNQRMFICQVAVGKYTKGDKTMKVAPPQDPSRNKHFLFDSLVDNVSNPTIYVVMSDSQAYPEYIVTFKTL